jgi:HEAT repeat protein
LAQALEDLEVREMARFALESNPSDHATEALLAALTSLGPVFLAGVINSLTKRRGAPVLAALRKAVEDPQGEVRLAALEALADFPEPSHDPLLEKSTRAEAAEERRRAHTARARLAETLRASGRKAAAERLYRAILASGAPESQKKAARLALGETAI